MAESTALKWWDKEAAPVRAVLDLAYMRSEFGEDAHDRVLDTFAPQHAETIRQIADDLAWAERMRSDYPSDALADYFGYTVRNLYALEQCERIAEEKEASALTDAQLVASLIVGAVAS